MNDAQGPGRTSVRLLVSDENGAVLLFLNAGVRGAGSEWWITPGGGVEPGESLHTAVLRELREELGAACADMAVVGPLLATREGVHSYGTVERPFRESYFPVTCANAGDISFDNFTAEEQSVIRAFTWCARDALEGTHDTVWPSDLGVIWDHWVRTESGVGVQSLSLRDRVDTVAPGEVREICEICETGLGSPQPHVGLDRLSLSPAP